MPNFTLPSDTQRISIIGRTGSGKTQLAAWVLSHAAFDRMPYIIIDYKRDQLLNEISYVEEIDVGEKIPKHPGLYITHPHPDQEEDLEKLLWAMWQRERVGAYVDEVYALPKNGKTRAFIALLTQGRSKKIPLIGLTQRPSWCTRFLFSEADYYSVFHLNDFRDRQTVRAFMDTDLEDELPQFHSRYFDVAKNKTFLLRPVPDRNTILDRFNQRLKPKRRFL